MKQILITVAVVVAVIAAAMFFSKDDGSNGAAANPSNHFYGSETASVVLTEYGDFQCPACAGFYPAIKQVKENLKDELRFEFKHFPLVQIHPNATAAHRAAEAAGNQDKFWEMHDLLYENQNSWSGSSAPSSIFESYAQQLNLDMEKYRSDFGSSETLAVINADIELGKAAGVNSTPSFFIDGEPLEDLSAISTVEGFENFIKEKISEKTGQSQDASSNSEEPAKPENEQ